MHPNRGLPKLQGGIAKAWLDAFERFCRMPGCGKPAAGMIETLSGPKPICAMHIPGAERVNGQLKIPVGGQKFSRPADSKNPGGRTVFLQVTKL